MTNKIRPFLKWPGRKYNLISHIKEHLSPPTKNNTLVEPFLGSAAVFLNTDYRNYHLSDNNPDLINTYNHLIKEGDKFIKYSSKYFISDNNNKNIYYELRDRFNDIKSTREKAALFIYLNKHGYNGLCRYNSLGKYNVPFGSYKKTYLPITEMQQFYNKSQSVNLELQCQDFTKCLSNINSDSVIYCDPPYIPISKTSAFTKYSKTDFTFDHQIKLVELIRSLKKQGYQVLFLIMISLKQEHCTMTLR